MHKDKNTYKGAGRAGIEHPAPHIPMITYKGKRLLVMRSKDHLYIGGYPADNYPLDAIEAAEEALSASRLN